MQSATLSFNNLFQSAANLSQTQSSGKTIALKDGFRQAFQQLMVDGNAEGMKMNSSLVEISKDDLVQLFDKLKQFMQSLTGEELKLDPTMLESKEVQELMEKLPEDLLQEVELLLEQNTSIDEVINKAEQLQSEAEALEQQGDEAELVTVFLWLSQSQVVTHLNGDSKTSKLVAEVSKELKSIIQSYNKESSNTKPLSGNYQNMIQTVMNESNQQVLKEKTELTNENVKQELKGLWEQIKPLLTQLEQKAQPSTQLEGKLFKLSEQWIQLQKQLQGKALNLNTLNVGTTNVNSETNGGSDLQAWNKIMANLSKRVNQGSKGYYQNATVTPQDLGKWVKQALKQGTQIQEVERTNQNVTQIGLDRMPMTRVEQHVIHVNGQQTQASQQQKLIEEFQRVIKTSRFIQKNGASELSIKLRPAHLGDMMVKLTQQNGEMIVKILVSSQAAKEMLEGNLKQLKHMFSPQQVVIEKQEQQVNQQQSNTTLFKEEQEEQDQSKNDSHEEKESQNEESEPELSFKDFLMNEKV